MPSRLIKTYERIEIRFTKQQYERLRKLALYIGVPMARLVHLTTIERLNQHDEDMRRDEAERKRQELEHRRRKRPTGLGLDRQADPAPPIEPFREELPPAPPSVIPRVEIAPRPVEMPVVLPRPDGPSQKELAELAEYLLAAEGVADKEKREDTVVRLLMQIYRTKPELEGAVRALDKKVKELKNER